MQPYKNYLSLPLKYRQSLISEAKQQQKHRKPNPQGTHQFQQYSFIPFEVEQLHKNKTVKVKLETYRFNAEGDIKGIVIMFHGLNSYIGHGAHLAHYFSQRGITTVGFDYRGFGRSEGRAGYVDNLEAHLKDCRAFVQIIKELYKGIPIFVLGLSMGGMTAYYLSFYNPQLFEGAILMAPALKNIVSKKVVKLTGILQSMLPDKARLSKPIYGKASKNPAITQFVKNDKYAFSQRMCLSTIEMMLSTMQKSPENFHMYNCPFVIVQGGLDKLVHPEVAFELYSKSKTKPQDKELMFYEEMWHDIWHQEEIFQILPKVTDWILKRVDKKIGKTKVEQNITEDNLNTKQKQVGFIGKQTTINCQLNLANNPQQKQ